MVEVAVIVSLLIGSMLGYNAQVDEADLAAQVVVDRSPPMNWGTKGHQDTMLMCRTMCGDTKVRKYEPITGQCECKE